MEIGALMIIAFINGVLWTLALIGGWLFFRSYRYGRRVMKMTPAERKAALQPKPEDNWVKLYEETENFYARLYANEPRR